MTYQEFSNLIKGGWYDSVEVKCQIPECTRIENCNKGSALRNFKRNGDIFKCRSCAFTEKGKKLISKATSYKRSEGTKQKMSESANKKWQTDWGQKQKKVLAKKAALQQSNTNLDKSKRKVLYISAKNNNVRVCNSSYEYIACEDFWEKNPNIKSYQTQVYYQVEGRQRNLDVLIELIDGSKKIIEIKPKKRLSEIVHKEQLEDSKKNADNQGVPFEIWTEEQLGIKNSKDATARADEYRKTHYLIDYAAYRQEQDRIKGRKHYTNKIAKDKVLVYCDYCKTYHNPLRLTYERNIKDNGNYICGRYGGHIAGKKSKPPRKENPFEEIGCKKCSQCDRILPLDNFSKGKCKCKECRATYYKGKYYEKT